METKVAELGVRVDNLEEWRDKHEVEDEKTHRYQSHMLENLLGKIAEIQLSSARFEADLRHRAGNETNLNARLQRISDRIAVLERMAWLALGSVGAVGAIATFFGWNILKLLAK